MKVVRLALDTFLNMVAFLAQEIVLWSEFHSVILPVRYIPGKKECSGGQAQLLRLGPSHGIVSS